MQQADWDRWQKQQRELREDPKTTTKMMMICPRCSGKKSPYAVVCRQCYWDPRDTFEDQVNAAAARERRRRELPVELL